MGFSQALSGLNAASSNLNVVSNNIANSQTVGFKSSTTQFADVYASSRVGLGVQVAGVVQNFTSGNLETTDRSLDLAISGSGFFRFEQAGQVVYSRNGQLTLTPEGYLQNAQGARLLGSNGAIQIPADGLQAQPTTEFDATLNLDSGSDVITAAFDATDENTYSYANTATVFDSLGNSHELTLYFTKTGTNEWAVNAALDGAVSASAAQALEFTTSGLLDGYTPTSFDFAMTNGAADISFELDLTGSTQFGNDFEVSSLDQDGYTAGSLVGFTIEENGNVVGNYSNEQSLVVGQIQLATFRSPEGLQPVGDNAWVETAASGQPLVGTAGSGQFGSLESGVVEASNVDLTKELVNLIIAQRNFQANAQSVSTQSEVLEQAVNLGR
ncbi:flagellar hook protein FlgE [Azotobacter vinelandii]|uniref:flagellar hook protein FlgE n=1 Tax=Azotobacter vinelandii TaxID=354 RepID=UPI00266657E3|nr:flagellar hook protein FlgE [Azotobacter vinelandii]WKN24272.1 flagellar hook protein FlgE [Azotobacter vinelandii]